MWDCPKCGTLAIISEICPTCYAPRPSEEAGTPAETVPEPVADTTATAATGSAATPRAGTGTSDAKS